MLTYTIPLCQPGYCWLIVSRLNCIVQKVTDAEIKKRKLILDYYSELTNKRADQNKRVWREDFFIHYMRVWWKFYVLHKKLKVWWKKDSKKTKRACSFIRKFRVCIYANACNYANSWIYVYMQMVLINFQNLWKESPHLDSLFSDWNHMLIKVSFFGQCSDQ